MPEALFDVINASDSSDARFIKAWKRGVQFEDAAVEQLKNTARLPFVRPYVAAMPDCHWGMGSTVGSVIPTVGAICPAAVGVDIGCGMLASRLNIKRESLHADFGGLRAENEKAIPMGRTDDGGDGDRGSWGAHSMGGDK